MRFDSFEIKCKQLNKGVETRCSKAVWCVIDTLRKHGNQRLSERMHSIGQKQPWNRFQIRFPSALPIDGGITMTHCTVQTDFNALNLSIKIVIMASNDRASIEKYFGIN